MTETKYAKAARESREKKAAAMALLPPLKLAKECWWLGRSEEWFNGGEANSRDEAIHIGTSDYDGDGFHIVCAKTDPVDVAAHFYIDRLIEDIDDSDDYLSGEGRDSVFEACPKDLIDDLENRIRLTIRTWQIEMQAAGIEIKGDLFTTQHSGEYVEGAKA